MNGCGRYSHAERGNKVVIGASNYRGNLGSTSERKPVAKTIVKYDESVSGMLQAAVVKYS